VLRPEENLQPVASDNDLAVLPYQGLAAGFRTGKYHAPAVAGGVASELDIARATVRVGLAT
jgi:aryl-alcohol dehydrogenase-like predicted oxidoreductase